MSHDGLLNAYVIRSENDYSMLDWDGVRAWKKEDGLLWVHLDRTEPQAKEWLATDSGVEPYIAEELLADATRPRLMETTEGFLILLRGVNKNEGKRAHDMVSLRIWVDGNRLISVRREFLESIRDVRLAIELEHAMTPLTSGDILMVILNGLTSRIGPVVDEIELTLDDMEERVVLPDEHVDRSELVDARRGIVDLYRYLEPQEDTLEELRDAERELLNKQNERKLNEYINRMTRYVEDLNAARNRAVIIQDELSNHLADEMAKRSYIFTVAATICLPLTVVTGLLGINVDGMPGSSDSPMAFIYVTVGLLVCAILIFIWMRLAKWL